MKAHDAGRADFAAVANLVAAFAALAAVTIAALTIRQMRDDAQQAHLGIGVESVWHLSDQWNSPAMLDVRSAAAEDLLAGKPNPEVGPVLDFFEEVVLLVDRGAV